LAQIPLAYGVPPEISQKAYEALAMMDRFPVADEVTSSSTAARDDKEAGVGFGSTGRQTGEVISSLSAEGAEVDENEAAVIRKGDDDEDELLSILTGGVDSDLDKLDALFNEDRDPEDDDFSVFSLVGSSDIRGVESTGPVDDYDAEAKRGISGSWGIDEFDLSVFDDDVVERGMVEKKKKESGESDRDTAAEQKRKSPKPMGDRPIGSGRGGINPANAVRRRRGSAVRPK